MALRWKTNNVTSPLSTWVDIIQGKHLDQLDAARQPTLGVSGVAFTGTQLLTNHVSVITANQNVAWLFIVTKDAGGGELLGDSGVGTTGYSVESNSQWFFESSHRLSSAITAGAIQDLVFSADANSKSYTNGILSVSSAFIAAFNVKTIGADQWENVPPGGDFFHGKIMEIIAWTNTLSSVDASNLHYYRTNVYGGSP